MLGVLIKVFTSVRRQMVMKQSLDGGLRGESHKKFPGKSRHSTGSCAAGAIAAYSFTALY